MGGAGRVRVCARRCGHARRQGARGVPLGLPRHRLARLVDAGAGRRGERGGPRGGRRAAGPAAGRALRRARSCHRAAGGRGGDRLCRLAQRSSQGHAGGGGAQARGRDDPRGVSHADPGVGPKPLRAYAFLEVAGEEERAGGARRPAWRSARESARERSARLLAVLRPPSARSRRGRRAAGDRRVPQGLPGAARDRAAAGGLRRRARAARARCWPIRGSRSRRRRSPPSPMPTRARTGR